jgi:protein N-terminal glutamine amidohydrolase
MIEFASTGRYASCYCEENVYWLCEESMAHNGAVGRTYALVISSINKRTPIWHQKKCSELDEPVLWDYHVIMVRQNCEGVFMAYDLDTQLPFPCPLEEYTEKSFRPYMELKEGFKQLFRVVEGSTYLTHFASDRRHMYRDGRWLAAPPSWPKLRGCYAESDYTLPSFIPGGLAAETQMPQAETEVVGNEARIQSVRDVIEGDSRGAALGPIVDVQGILETLLRLTLRRSTHTLPPR